jgi:dethiobiotin synthetase
MTKPIQVFISGIGTEIGKTFCSAILVKALDADYWKPVQAGNCDEPDREFVKSMTQNSASRFFEERHFLTTPCSPHLAAKIDGIRMQLNDFQIPNTTRNLIVEGAGGLLVPISENHTIIDLIEHLELPVILISKHYLGSINHTLLSIEALRQRKIPLLGVLFNGGSNPESETIICKLGNVQSLGTVNQMSTISPENIEKEAIRLRNQILNTLNIKT